MYLADYHMHSRCSMDANVSMTEMAAAAVKAGLDEICFTDHMEPVVGTVNIVREHFDWEKMSQEFADAQKAYGDQIRLRLGVELGDAMWDFSRTERLLAEGPKLDFIIGSVHMLSERFDGIDLYFFAPKSEEEARAGMADYLEQVQKMANWGKFHVLGHLTLPLRYLNENHGFHLTFDGFESEIEQILRTLIQSGVGIELNTNRGHLPLPDTKWLKLYRSLGGEIITLGTDAHTTEFVGCAIRERQKLLQECGFQRFCTFDSGTPVWHPLS